MNVVEVGAVERAVHETEGWGKTAVGEGVTGGLGLEGAGPAETVERNAGEGIVDGCCRLILCFQQHTGVPWRGNATGPWIWTRIGIIRLGIRRSGSYEARRA